MDLARLSEGNEAAPPDGRGLHEGTCLLQHLEAHTGSALTINIGFCFLLHCRKWQTALLLLTRRGVQPCNFSCMPPQRVWGEKQPREPNPGENTEGAMGWQGGTSLPWLGCPTGSRLTAPGRTARTQHLWHKDFWEGKQGSHLLPTWRLGLRALLPPMEHSRAGRRSEEV